MAQSAILKPDKGTPIPANSNLNNYNNAGLYYAGSNSDAASLSNKPSTLSVAFSMIVLDKGGYNMQVIFSNGGEIYIRGHISTGWNSWVRFTGN